MLNSFRLSFILFSFYAISKIYPTLFKRELNADIQMIPSCNLIKHNGADGYV